MRKEEELNRDVMVSHNTYLARANSVGGRSGFVAGLEGMINSVTKIMDENLEEALANATRKSPELTREEFLEVIELRRALIVKLIEWMKESEGKHVSPTVLATTLPAAVIEVLAAQHALLGLARIDTDEVKGNKELIPDAREAAVSAAHGSICPTMGKLHDEAHRHVERFGEQLSVIMGASPEEIEADTARRAAAADDDEPSSATVH